MNHQPDANNQSTINLIAEYFRETTYGPESGAYLWVGRFADDTGGRPVGRAFTSWADAAAYTASIDAPGTRGVYHQARLTDADHGPYSRGAADAPGWLHFFQLDADVDGPGHKRGDGDGLHPYPRTRDEVHALIGKLGWGEPSLVIDSGGGLYPRWTFPEPIRNTPEAREMFKALGAHALAVWASEGRHLDSTFDAARVFRVPGTYNRKTGDEGAPLCRPVRHDNGKRYTLAGLLSASGVTPVQRPAAPVVPVAPVAAPPSPASMLFASPSDLDDGRKDIYWWRELLDAKVSGLVPGDFNNGLNILALWAGRGVPGAWPRDEAQTWLEDAVRTVRREPTGEDLGTIRSGLSAAGTAPDKMPFSFRPGTETRPADAPKGGEGMSIELAPSNLPDSFWESRESLKLIRAVAHSRYTSADAVLGGVLARVAAALPPQCGPDTGVGGDTTSLNSIIALVAPSGGGKSSGLSVVKQVMPEDPHWNPHSLPLGSGEGIAEAYMGMVDEENEDTGKTRKVKRKIHDNVLMVKDEGAELVEIMTGRQGSTIGSVLRAAWSGEDIGQANGKAETTRIVPGGTYSLGMTIGFQETVAGKLFTPDEVAKGTVQRFLWLSASDPSIPAPPEGPTDAPEPIRARLKLATGIVPDDGPLADMWRDAEVPTPEPRWSLPKTTVPASVRLEIQKYVWSVNTGQTTPDPMDSQRPRMRVKLACLLAILDGRTDATVEDFQLADQVYATSCLVRGRILRMAKAAQEEETARALALRKRHAAAQEAGRQEQAGSCMAGHLATIARKVAESGSGLSRTDIRNGFKHRDCLDDALGQLVGEGVLRLDGRRYFAT